jgi:hypothetical protein
MRVSKSIEHGNESYVKEGKVVRVLNYLSTTP